MSWQAFAWKSAFSRISEKPEGRKYELFGIYNDINDNPNMNTKESILKFIDMDVVGKSASFQGPYGCRRIVYCDYIASGKALRSIEQFIMKYVLPMYANTHTQSNATGSQTSAFRKEAKDIIRKAVNADEDDAVIFAGSGVTGAIHKLISVLQLKQPPVVFCGPFEHHSNLLPWREMNGHVVQINEDINGKVDMRHLEIALKFWSKSGRPLIGSFSVASNITGITTDTRKVAAMLHKYGAISLWDYATGAPYLNIDMHPDPHDGYDSSKDAVFISPHKFVGSPDAPGLLIASKHLFHNDVPSAAGGGTVLFVSANDHRYLKDIETREEGGTPAIIGSIRAGLAFKLKMTVGCNVIMNREEELYNKAMKVWKGIPELEILGILDKEKSSASAGKRLAVFSFLIKHPHSGLYLHHNFVAQILNDLFGIQTRGGCACAGVYAQHLLSINHEAERRFGSVLLESPERAKRRKPGETERTEYEITRPGFTRLNLPYFISNEEADFIISAVGMVAKNGWTILPQYRYHATSGQWSHVDHDQSLEETSLSDISFNFDGLRLNHGVTISNTAASPIQCLKKAERIFFNATTIVGKDLPNQTKLFSDPAVRDLRWFLLPYEAQTLLRGKKIDVRKNLIFQVRREIKPISDDALRASLAPSNGYIPLSKECKKTKDLIAENIVENKNKKNKRKGFGLKSIFGKSTNTVDVLP